MNASNAILNRRQLLRRAPALVALGAIFGGGVSCAPLRPLDPGAPTALPSPTAALAPMELPTTAPPTTSLLSSSVPSPTAAPAGSPSPAALSPTPSPTLRPSQPNVLVITIDTLRSDRIGAYGFGQAHTPTLDRLATEGVRFNRAICQLPQTNPSHTALLTGLYASTSGVKVHMVDKLRPGSQTMASVFAGAGYETAGIYSWVSFDPQFSGLNQGFQTYAGYVINRSLLFSDPRIEGLLALYREAKANLPVVKTVDVALGGSESVERSLDGRADVTTDAVLKWLAGRPENKPFFLWVHYFDPHYPYAPPSGYDNILGLNYQGKIDGSVDTIHAIEDGKLSLDNADRARLGELYQGEIAFADAQIGRLLDDLRRKNLEDDTITVVVADHGESFGEHGDWTHGLKVYETEIHVPLILRYPRRVAPGRAIPDPVQLIDVMPTLLDLTGIRAPKPVQGTSFVPLIAPTTASAPVDRAAFTELADEAFTSVVTRDWKLIRNNANGQLQLYHISQDEAERRNLAESEPSTARELNARLSALMKFSGVSR